jgi:class 3 adenylate cyclase
LKASKLVILDMGEYEVPGINLELVVSGQAPRQQQGPADGGKRAGQQPQDQEQQERRRQRQQRRRKSGRLRVYSVAPSCLADRAREWGNSLAFKEGWRQTDRGFFEAPGAVGAATLTLRDAAVAPDLMPHVTVVCAGVEGAKWLVRWRHAGEVREMARLLRMVYVAALRAVPGGYLCREQEGGLRYMLAFRDAEGALQWCLLVQEALMYAPWPAALLALLEFGEQHTRDGGTLLFRGPRVKMGVCEGRPRSLVANEEGRADYFGASVNQAARYMDAAARGGQVACDLQLVEAAFR